MLDFILQMIKKHKSFIAYGVFGVFTTIVNIVTYNVCYSRLGISNTLSNIAAWVLAVTFAYLTNKDVVRHPLVQQIVTAYDEYEKKQQRRKELRDAKETETKKENNYQRRRKQKQ